MRAKRLAAVSLVAFGGLGGMSVSAAGTGGEPPPATCPPSVSPCVDVFSSDGELSMTPASGPVGTEVTLRSVTPCPPAPDPDAKYQVNTAFGELPVIIPLPPEGGHWETGTRIVGIVPGQNVLEFPAECNFPADGRLQPTLRYKPARFTIEDPRPAPSIPAPPRFTG